MRALFALTTLCIATACSQEDIPAVDRKPLSQTELQNRPDIHSIDFGTDRGDWANDGECDDPRFVGPGMTGTALLEDDLLNDASDCRRAYAEGLITIRSGDNAD